MIFASPDGAEERSPLLEANDNVTPALDGKRQKIEIRYRPDQPLPDAKPFVAAVDDGRYPQPANDNRPVRYYLARKWPSAAN